MRQMIIKIKHRWYIFTIMLCCIFSACGTPNKQVSGDIPPLKQISMLDQRTGWALTQENEVLYTSAGIDHFQMTKTIELASRVTDQFVNAYFLDEANAYLAYFSDDGENIIVEYTENSGEDWNQTSIPYQEYGGPNAVFVDFADEQNGYLLYCSDPGAGQMTKVLFKTTDGGKYFELVSDISSVITGYPTGISYSSTQQGFITVTYHGEDNYLFRTTDGGNNWENVSVELEEDSNEISYVDGYAPCFYGDAKQDGKMILKLAGEETSYMEYESNDGGSTWNKKAALAYDSIQSYSFYAHNTGFVIDENGGLFRY